MKSGTSRTNAACCISGRRSKATVFALLGAKPHQDASWSQPHSCLLSLPQLSCSARSDCLAFTHDGICGYLKSASGPVQTGNEKMSVFIKSGSNGGGDSAPPAATQASPSPPAPPSPSPPPPSTSPPPPSQKSPSPPPPRLSPTPTPTPSAGPAEVASRPPSQSPSPASGRDDKTGCSCTRRGVIDPKDGSSDCPSTHQDYIICCKNYNGGKYSGCASYPISPSRGIRVNCAKDEISACCAC